MNELDVIGSVRAEVGPPSSAQLATGRARLVGELARTRPAGPRRRMVLRAALAGGLAVAATGALITAQSLGPGSPVPAPPRTEALAAVLTKASHAATDITVPPGKALYIEQKLAYGSPDGPFWPTRLESWQVNSPDWWDKEWSPVERRGPRPKGFKLGSQPPKWDFTWRSQASLDKLPTDPDRLLHSMYWNRKSTKGGKVTNGSSAESVRYMLGELLQQPNTPAKVRSAAFLALAKVPGAKLLGDVTDAAGRHGTGIDLGTPHLSDPALPEGTTLILDPRTHQLLGTRRRDSHRVQNKDGNLVVQTQLIMTANIRTAVVNKYGDRP